MKRFTETEKWNDPWFRKLPGAHKLVFIFLIENCNNAGFYEFDIDHVAYLTALKREHVEGALEALGRGIKAADGWIWIKNFLRHQKNEDLNHENPAHRNIISLLRVQIERFKNVEDFEKFVAPYEGLLSPIGKGLVKEKVEGMKSPEKKGTPEAPLEPPPKLNTDAFKAAWARYVAYRVESKLKPLKTMSIAQKWLELAGWGHDQAIAAINASISNGHQGIFEPKKNGSGKAASTVHVSADVVDFSKFDNRTTL